MSDIHKIKTLGHTTDSLRHIDLKTMSNKIHVDLHLENLRSTELLSWSV